MKYLGYVLCEVLCALVKYYGYLLIGRHVQLYVTDNRVLNASKIEFFPLMFGTLLYIFSFVYSIYFKICIK